MSAPFSPSLLFAQRGWWLLMVVVVSTLVSTLLFYRHQSRYPNLVAHEDGVIYRSAALEPDALQDVIREYGIRTVVHLGDGDAEWPETIQQEREAAEAGNAHWIELPLPKTMNAADPRIAGHLELLGDRSNFPILVYSRDGINRTAMFLAIYDIAIRGMSARESLEAQPRFGLHEHTAEVQLFVRNFEHHYQHRHRDLINTAGRPKPVH